MIILPKSPLFQHTLLLFQIVNSKLHSKSIDYPSRYLSNSKFKLKRSQKNLFQSTSVIYSRVMFANRVN